MRNMLEMTPTNYNAPDYRYITGEFRDNNPDLFIDEQAPKELQDAFYTKSITPQFLALNPSYIPYLKDKDLKSCFKLRKIEVKGIDALYNYENFYGFLLKKTDFDSAMDFITKYSNELEIIFNSSRFLFNNPLSHDLKINIDCNFDNIKEQFHQIIESTKFKFATKFSEIKDVTLQDVFIEYYRDFGNDINVKKIDYIFEILTRLSLSNSIEMFTFRKELANQLLKSDNPIENLNKIEDIFLKNNIPTIGKLYSCFEILHPDFQGFNFANTSPALKKSSNSSKKIIIFSDLLKASMGSNNKSIKDYLKNIEIGSKLYESLKNEQIKLENLNEKDLQELVLFTKHLATLYNNTSKVKNNNNLYDLSDDILKDLNILTQKISPNGTLDYNLADRVIRMFCGFMGVDTLEKAKAYIETKIENANNRNRNAANSDMKLEQGDLIKGIGNITYLKNILQNGSASKEYLGSSAGSDNTPLDTDVSMIMSDNGTILDKINDTAAKAYGPIWFVLKNDDRFITTRTSSEEINAKRDMSKLELFYTGVLGEGHYGIRTGFASSEINYIVMEKYDSRVGLEIAMNGFYIPVYNIEGKIVFTPRDYDELRNKMSGLTYFDEENYHFSNNLVNEDTKLLAEQIDESNNEVEIKRKKINNVIKNSLEELGLHLKTKIDGDLTEGFVELIDTGSTGRGTNKPGDGDFDFMMRLDKNILTDDAKLQKLKHTLLKNLSNEYSNVITGNGDFRLKNVQIDNDTKVDIDITFTEKTDKITYSTDMALQDRLTTIKQNDPLKYKYVVANILLAKQVLKSAGVYKSSHAETPQGGLGGVGIENWILQNGGSFMDAIKSFMEASNGKNFEEFQKEYQIWDFGENHLADRKNHYAHDNFVTNNMNKEGYEKMCQALREYLKIHELNQNDLESGSITL